MPRRPSIALALAVAIAALTACADPTAPSPRTNSVDVRHSGYVLASGRDDSTSTRGR